MFSWLAHNVKNLLRKSQLAFGNSPEQQAPFQNPSSRAATLAGKRHPIIQHPKSVQFTSGMTDKNMANNFIDFATRYVSGTQELVKALAAQLQKRYDKQFQKSSAPTLTRK